MFCASLLMSKCFLLQEEKANEHKIQIGAGLRKSAAGVWPVPS